MYQKLLNSLSVFLLLITLTGCIQSVAPPLNGPTAQLAEHQFSKASVAIYADPIECKTPRPLYPLLGKTKNQFVTIPANKPLTLRVVTYADFSEVPAIDNLTFIPEAGQKYIVVRHYSKNARFTYRVQILKVKPAKNNKPSYLPVRYIQREDGFFSACTDEQMKENIKRISTSYQAES